MLVLPVYLLRQAGHARRSLKFRTRFEIYFFLIIFIAFFSTRAISLIQTLQNDFSDFWIARMAALVFSLLIAAAVPFIHRFLFPRIKALNLMRVLPLQPKEAAIFLLSVFFRYSIPGFLIAVPVAVALMAESTIVLFLYFILIIPLFVALMVFYFGILAFHYPRLYRNTGLYFFSLLTFGAVNFIPVGDLLMVVFNCLFIIISLPPVVGGWLRHAEDWDRSLQLQPRPDSQRHRLAAANFFYRRAAGNRPLRILIVRDWLGYLRNRAYLRLKIGTLLFYTVLLATIFRQVESQNTTVWVLLLSVVIIWIHYAQQFNRKYVFPESPWFLKTLPVSFTAFWLAKFLAELVYVLILLLIAAIFMFLNISDPVAAGQTVLVLLLFAVFVLAIITTIRLYFFDNPRLGGYAYHFLILFCLIMNLNFYLVGPLVTFVLLLYLLYLSQKEFKL